MEWGGWTKWTHWTRWTGWTKQAGAESPNYFNLFGTNKLPSASPQDRLCPDTNRLSIVRAGTWIHRQRLCCRMRFIQVEDVPRLRRSKKFIRTSFRSPYGLG